MALTQLVCHSRQMALDSLCHQAVFQTSHQTALLDRIRLAATITTRFHTVQHHHSRRQLESVSAKLSLARVYLCTEQLRRLAVSVEILAWVPAPSQVCPSQQEALHSRQVSVLGPAAS